VSAKTPAERKQDERQRQRRLGRRVVQVWVHPDDREKLARYVKRLNKQRGDPVGFNLTDSEDD
jgi:hypothetical protein